MEIMHTYIYICIYICFFYKVQRHICNTNYLLAIFSYNRYFPVIIKSGSNFLDIYIYTHAHIHILNCSRKMRSNHCQKIDLLPCHCQASSDCRAMWCAKAYHFLLYFLQVLVLNKWVCNRFKVWGLLFLITIYPRVNK